MSPTPLRVLIVENSEDDTLLIVRALRTGGYDPIYERVDSPDALEAALRNNPWDAVITDYVMPHFSGMDALRIIKKHNRDLPVIIVSGSITEETAVEAMREGAHDYITKGHLPRLVCVLERELRDAKTRRERTRADQKLAEERAILRTVIDNLPDYIYVKDRSSNFVINNKAHYLLMRAKSQEEIVGKNDFDFFPKELAQRYYDDEQELMNSGTSIIDKEQPLQDQHGQMRWVTDTKIPLRDQGGNIIGLVGISHDITLRKKAEEALKQSLENLRRTLQETVNALSITTEKRDPFTAGHQQRVAKLAARIGEEMKLPPDVIEGISVASILHDIGKIYIPIEILNKPGRLTENEMCLIKTHPQVGYDILKNISFNWPIAQIVYQHHERINGTGYPRSLSDGNILLEAKIVAVADVVEAIASHRPYRPAHGIDVALEEIAQHAGSMYDPGIVKVCLKLFSEKGFSFE